MTLLRRVGFTVTGVLAGVQGGVCTFIITCAVIMSEIVVNQKSNKEDLMILDKTQREQAIMKGTDIVSIGGGVFGGLVGLKFGNVPQFSFLRFLGITTGGFFAGGVFTVAATLAASHMIKAIKPEANNPKNS